MVFGGGGNAAKQAGSARAVKRITHELKEINNNPSKVWTAEPVNDDLFEWHFTLKGPIGSEFEKGIYHGRIVLPLDWPFSPPEIRFLTPNGRFEINKNICLSNSSYHPELWQPAWGIRTIIEGIRSFFPASGEGAVGALNWSPEVRRKIAETESRIWKCPTCNKTNFEILPLCDEAEEDGLSSSGNEEVSKIFGEGVPKETSSEDDKTSKEGDKESKHGGDSTSTKPATANICPPASTTAPTTQQTPATGSDNKAGATETTSTSGENKVSENNNSTSTKPVGEIAKASESLEALAAIAQERKKAFEEKQKKAKEAEEELKRAQEEAKKAEVAAFPDKKPAAAEEKNGGVGVNDAPAAGASGSANTKTGGEKDKKTREETEEERRARFRPPQQQGVLGQLVPKMSNSRILSVIIFNLFLVLVALLYDMIWANPPQDVE